MRILVTGGCGFIGSHFVRLVLTQRPGFEVWNVDKLTYAGNVSNLEDVEAAYPNRYHFVRADISDQASMNRLLAQHPFDCVVHFAAESHVDRSIHDATPFLVTNVLGTQILLEAARKAGIPRFVHVSTDEVYGSLGPEGAFSEDSPIAPNSPYAASKASSDLLVRAAHRTHKQDVVITRCSNNYGPFQFPEKLIPLMIRRAMKDEALPVYGKGENVRDWIYVEDHCRGVLMALESGKSGEVYNFGGAAERSNISVVREISHQLGKPESLIHFVKDRPGHDERYAMDFSKAARELGFAPRMSFDQGLSETVQWYLSNESWVQGVESGAYLAFERLWYGERT